MARHFGLHCWHFLDKFIVFFVNGKRHVLQGITRRQHSLDANDLMSLLPFDHLDLDTHNPLPLHHLDTLICLHGMPRSIVRDRGQIFVSNFWGAFFKLQGTKLCRSSAYHPQSDGQTEVVNLSLEHYLHCCFIVDKPDSWSSLLHWAEWWHNT